MRQQPGSYSSGVRRYLPLGGTLALALAILGATIFVSEQGLRHKSREQITGQRARIIYELWKSQKFEEEPEAGPQFNERASDQLPAVLQTARLKQLAPLGTRLFETNGAFLYADPNVSESTLVPRDLAELRKLNPVAHLRESADLSEVRVELSEASPVKGALLEVSIPLHAPSQKQLAGIAQFLFDGTDVAAEFHTLDRNVNRQAWLTFWAGGALLAAVLVWGFHKQERAARLLAERTQSLLQANQELALAAKTSAVGALTAHLIHGLKNPLSGLQTFVASRGTASDDGTDTDWQLAVSSTRRMQAMISEIVRVLRDEEADSQYELSLEEFVQVLGVKVQPLAREAGVEFRIRLAAQGTLRNREANLISLVLYNLVQNAIQATPKGKSVTLSFCPLREKIACEVKDEGEGISNDRQGTLFKPCRSTKEGGSGIGLAISKQLANYIGADLDLKETSSHGSVFVLVFETTRQPNQAGFETEKIAS